MRNEWAVLRSGSKETEGRRKINVRAIDCGDIEQFLVEKVLHRGRVTNRQSNSMESRPKELVAT